MEEERRFKHITWNRCVYGAYQGYLNRHGDELAKYAGEVTKRIVNSAVMRQLDALAIVSQEEYQMKKEVSYRN